MGQLVGPRVETAVGQAPPLVSQGNGLGTQFRLLLEELMHAPASRRRIIRTGRVPPVKDLLTLLGAEQRDFVNVPVGSRRHLAEEPLEVTQHSLHAGPREQFRRIDEIARQRLRFLVHGEAEMFVGVAIFHREMLELEPFEPEFRGWRVLEHHERLNQRHPAITLRVQFFH